MSEIDLTKPLQWCPDGKQWLDVTWDREMPDGALIIEYGGDCWAMTRNPKDCAKLRNKPEQQVRPYTFEEARSLVGQRIRYGDTDALVVAAWPCPVRGAVIKAGELQSRSLKEALAEYTHHDGTPFGVIESE